MQKYNDVLYELQDYILNNENIKKALNIKCLTIEKPNLIYKNEVLVKNIKIDLYIPKEQDTLFWCFYIMKNGFEKYETLPYKNYLVAKQIKIDLISIIRKNKDIVKKYKFDSISSIENNLANENNINIKSFFSLCAIENLNVIYINKNSYFELIMNDSDIYYKLQDISKYGNKFGFTLASEELLQNIRNSLYKINNIEKPIKSLSIYKISELQEICNKLSIELIDKNNGKKKSKKDLYESIIQYF
jgi:hypothetical protein